MKRNNIIEDEAKNKNREMEYQLIQFLKNKIQEELNIDKAKHNWEIIRKKKKVINILVYTQDFEMLKSLNNTDSTIQKGNKYHQPNVSKFIISPNNP